MRNERNLTFKIRTFGQGNDFDDRALMIANRRFISPAIKEFGLAERQMGNVA